MNLGTMQKEKIVTTAITTEMDERFQAFCTANNTNKSAMVRKLIRACLERHGVSWKTRE